MKNPKESLYLTFRRSKYQISDSEYRYQKVYSDKYPEIQEERTYTQAQRVISAFGGPAPMARALKIANPDRNWCRSTITRWLYDKDEHSNGTGGSIPTSALRHIRKAARLWGILLDPEILLPEPMILHRGITTHFHRDLDVREQPDLKRNYWRKKR